ncbi:hypothetical protein [Brucella pituitosa]|uniref:Capsid protein n=1 Tax=Brucella pituitosa TaxID=571256 RepID=A0ABS3K1H0_9HYPH|nr:hypothetical protein [Brucella pituitosa]MBO1040190.1 hypothetical protein [Brucella pituitosa]
MGESSAISQILSNFDIGDIATFAVTAGAAVVGIALAIKGIQYAKRFVRMA